MFLWLSLYDLVADCEVNCKCTSVAMLALALTLNNEPISVYELHGNSVLHRSSTSRPGFRPRPFVRLRVKGLAYEKKLRFCATTPSPASPNYHKIRQATVDVNPLHKNRR